jgi:hypothetical protein
MSSKTPNNPPKGSANQHEIRSLLNFISEDGKETTLRIGTKHGVSQVKFRHEMLTKFILDLIDIGAIASRRRTNGRSVLFAEASAPKAAQTQSSGVAVHMPPGGSQLDLVVRLWDMDLPFQVTLPTINALAEAIADMQKDLNAGTDTTH